MLFFQYFARKKGSGRSSISKSVNNNSKRGHYPVIRPKFPKNCMKMKEIVLSTFWKEKRGKILDTEWYRDGKDRYW